MPEIKIVKTHKERFKGRTMVSINQFLWKQVRVRAIQRDIKTTVLLDEMVEQYFAYNNECFTYVPHKCLDIII